MIGQEKNQTYFSSNIDSGLKAIAEKVISEQRITVKEGIYLFEKGELGFLGILANYIRTKKHGDYTYFNRNFHIEPTNICVFDCKFCSYSRLLKHRKEGWELSADDILEKVKEPCPEALVESALRNIEILEKDLRIDTYRSSGAGGQHVNTTDSAVRITHIPSKIVVQCQNERSQHKNKETCMNMLKARLYDYEVKKKEQENQNTENSKSEIGWGHQIRSYVLQPYRLVKDNRTNFESTSPDKVLDGEIDDFLEQSLYQIK